jgi:hypothetical protein
VKRGRWAARVGKSGADERQIGDGVDPGKVSMAIGQCETRKTNPAFPTETAALLRDRTNPGAAHSD